MANLEHEDRTAGQVDKGVVRDPNDNETFSYELGRNHGLLLQPPRPRDTPNVEEAQYWEGYNEGIGDNLQKGVISVNRARELLGLWKPSGEPIPAQPDFDAVKIPQHYNTGQIEVANFIADQELAYPADNIIKYVVRAGKKDPAKKIEDIEKAAAYLQMMHNLANGLPAVVRDPETREVVWSLFRN